MSQIALSGSLVDRMCSLKICNGEETIALYVGEVLTQIGVCVLVLIFLIADSGNSRIPRWSTRHLFCNKVSLNFL